MSIQPEYFGKYILLDKLATGGMAEVYLAKSLGAENVSKLLAVKRILPQFSQNQEFVEMFKEEAKIAMNISHGNIVSIFEFGEERGQFFIVMEYVEGRNLRQILNRLNKSEMYFGIDDIVYLIKEAATGLDHAHKHIDPTTGKPLNITHRDISPQNIMISFDGEVKIVDFGIAKAESKLETTRAGTLKGKFGYMSPEQAEGMEVDYRTDIFSLGTVFWELMARERLFLANNEVNTLKKIRDARIPGLKKIDPSIPEELERIANKALARDRNLRYQSAQEFHRDLSKFLNRHYPEFNVQDFSSKIKSLYSKEREELREKLIEFAKVQVPNVSDATQVVGDHTKTITESGTNSKKEDTHTVPQNLVSDRELKKVSSELNLKIDPKDKNLLTQKTITHHLPKRPASTASGYPGAGTSTGYPYRNGTTSTAYRAAPPTSSSNFILFVVFTIGLSFVSFFFLQKRYPEQATAYMELAKSKIYPLIGREYAEEGTVTQASTDHILVVTSIPAGAEIEVNSVKMGVTTPGKVRVPAGREFTLGLSKEGYNPYLTEMKTAQDANEVRVNLVKANVGYVNIQVRPGNAAVYVDGKRLPQAPPIYNHPVPADRPVKITAFDSVSQGAAETIVQVKKDTRQEVNLFLQKRAPTATK